MISDSGVDDQRILLIFACDPLKRYPLQKLTAAPVMNRIHLLLAFALGGTISIVAPPLQAHEPQPASAARLLTTASAFLASLSPEQRQKAVFPLDHPERKDWSNLPHTLHPRKGVGLGELSPHQRVQAHHLIQAGLSSQGYLKASGIMQLDEILLHLAGQASSQQPMFGLHLYWISFLGEPSAKDPWGWQLDGHHLALNFAVVDQHVAMTPTFMGSDPHEVRDGPHAGWRVLGAEDDKGLFLMKSLSREQQRQALLSAAAPNDIITGPGRDKALQRFEGLTGEAFKALKCFVPTRSSDDVVWGSGAEECLALLLPAQRLHQEESFVVLRAKDAPAGVGSVPDFVRIRAHESGGHGHMLVHNSEIQREMMAVQLPAPGILRRRFPKERDPVEMEAEHRLLRTGLAGQVEEDFIELHDAAGFEIPLAAEPGLDQVMCLDPLVGGKFAEADPLSRVQGMGQVAPVFPFRMVQGEDRLLPLFGG